MTAEDIQRALQAELRATDDTSADQITKRALRVARLEGSLATWTRYETVVRCVQVDYPDFPMQVKLECMKMLVRMLINGPDDTWSGRGNDTRRARFDGKIAAAEEIYYDILRMES